MIMLKTTGKKFLALSTKFTGGFGRSINLGDNGKS